MKDQSGTWKKTKKVVTQAEGEEGFKRKAWLKAFSNEDIIRV